MRPARRHLMIRKGVTFSLRASSIRVSRPASRNRWRRLLSPDFFAQATDDVEIKHPTIAGSKAASVEDFNDFFVRVLAQQAIDLFDDFRFGSGNNAEGQRSRQL